MKLDLPSTIDATPNAPGAVLLIARGQRGVVFAATLAGVLASSLAGCGSITERTAASAFTSPGKYDIYSCQEIEGAIASVRARQTELEQLMARAAQGAGGEFVNTMVYRGEYATTRGELVELNKSRAEKQCVADSRYSSGRAVF